MGFFTSKTIFSTHEQIKDALFHIESLDYKQREIAFEAISAKLSGGGVTQEELKKVITDLRHAGQISEIDQKNLLALIK
ncbi:MAG: hypothetical protein WCW26_03090 [Candidatus Buchananbacteria bacterium]